MPTPPPDLLAALADDVRDAYRRVFPTGSPASAAELRARVDQHLGATTRAARANEFVDSTLSHTIADRLRDLLDAWDAMTVEDRSIVHAVVAYYALSEDAEDDLEWVLGFEDDARVFDACVRFLGRPQLQILSDSE